MMRSHTQMRLFLLCVVLLSWFSGASASEVTPTPSSSGFPLVELPSGWGDSIMGEVAKTQFPVAGIDRKKSEERFIRLVRALHVSGLDDNVFIPCVIPLHPEVNNILQSVNPKAVVSLCDSSSITGLVLVFDTFDTARKFMAEISGSDILAWKEKDTVTVLLPVLVNEKQSIVVVADKQKIRPSLLQALTRNDIVDAQGLAMSLEKKVGEIDKAIASMPSSDITPAKYGSIIRQTLDIVSPVALSGKFGDMSRIDFDTCHPCDETTYSILGNGRKCICKDKNSNEPLVKDAILWSWIRHIKDSEMKVRYDRAKKESDKGLQTLSPEAVLSIAAIAPVRLLTEQGTPVSVPLASIVNESLFGSVLWNIKNSESFVVENGERFDGILRYNLFGIATVSGDVVSADSPSIGVEAVVTIPFSQSSTFSILAPLMRLYPTPST